MTERHGSGYGEEGGRRPSGRGAVTERLARQEPVNEIDLTDETTERGSSGAFEPADTTRPGASSIFDVDERARGEEQHPTGYEPPVAEAVETREEQAEAREEAAETREEQAEVREEAAETREESAEVREESAEAHDEAAEAHDEAAEGTPAPVAEPPAEAPAAEAAAAERAAAEAPAAPTAPDAAAPASLLGSLDGAEIRGRFLDIQAGFIDEPRQAVEEAGRFIDDLLRQVAETLQQQRGQLTGATDEASTEDLRLALRAYRQFVDRLLGLAS
jgi:chemotaxis protein histidine kinase CheA